VSPRDRVAERQPRHRRVVGNTFIDCCSYSRVGYPNGECNSSLRPRARRRTSWSRTTRWCNNCCKGREEKRRNRWCSDCEPPAAGAACTTRSGAALRAPPQLRRGGAGWGGVGGRGRGRRSPTRLTEVSSEVRGTPTGVSQGGSLARARLRPRCIVRLHTFEFTFCTIDIGCLRVSRSPHCSPNCTRFLVELANH